MIRTAVVVLILEAVVVAKAVTSAEPVLWLLLALTVVPVVGLLAGLAITRLTNSFFPAPVEP